MAKIVFIYENWCMICGSFVDETAHEMEDLFYESCKVRRKINPTRCKKCEPEFKKLMAEAEKAGKVSVIPFGKSGKKKEDRQGTLRDFIGRDKGKEKKEAGHDDRLLRMQKSHPARR